MNTRRYSKFLAGLGSILILLLNVGTPALAAAGNTALVISGSVGVAGATLSYTDGYAMTATADSSGNYSFAVSYNWTGTVTPSRTGYTFSPLSRSYTNLLAGQTGQDYTASRIGCANAAGTGAIPFPTGGKTVTVALPQEPDLVDALFSSMPYSIWVDQSVQVGLATWDADNNFVPELAVDVPTTLNGGISADGLTITWHLKPCLYWSDGQPLTSADVKFTWQVETDPINSVATRAGYDQIDSIDIPDDNTVILHFDTLYPGWQTLFTSGPLNQGNIQPMHILQGITTDLVNDPFIRWPTVSSGPWVITDWVAGDTMTLLPNPNYWRGHPKLDQILIKFISDPVTALAALQAGTVDFVPEFPESDLAALIALEPAIHTRVDPGLDFEHYFFNLGVQGTGVGQSDYEGFCPFKNVDVRKAILLGIDRQTLVDDLLLGMTSVPASLWPNSYWYNTSLTPYPYDPDQARTLLQNAGYTAGTDGIRHGMCNSVDTRLSFNFETTTKQVRIDLAAAVQDMLAEIGVEFKPIHTPAGTFFASYSDGGNMATGNFDMAGYTTGFYPDPMAGVMYSFACSSVPSASNPTGTNNYHLCDPALDGLMAAVNASADPAARKVVLDQIQQNMYDNALVVPIYARFNVMAYRDCFILPPTSAVSGTMGDTFDWDVKLKTISGNTGVGAATLYYTGGSTVADAGGIYSITVHSGWSGTVRPFKPGYTFSPVNRAYNNVQANQIDQDYTAITYRIYLPLVIR